MISSDLPPIVWPSLTDLAHLLGSDLSTFSRLASVRETDRPRIGREVKIAPADAVRILKERGLSHGIAEQQVNQLVLRRATAIPALRHRGLAAAPEPAARLVPSLLRTHHAARLWPTVTPRVGAVRPLQQPDMRRFERRDRDLGKRRIPLERYIYEQS